jgi:hypothetical protein
MAVRADPPIPAQAITAKQADISPTQVDDPYRYGYRVVPETQKNGEITYQFVPLAQADFLDPQVGDHLVQSDPHVKLVISLVNRFEKRYLYTPAVGVFSDLKMEWGIPGLKEPAPDLAIVPGLKNKQKRRSTFDVAAEGTRPCLIVEVTSPRYPFDDTVKVGIYQQAGIQEYIIVDAHFEEDDAAVELKGYRLVEGEFQPMTPDAQGSLVSETTGVRFGLDAVQRRLILTDAVTGERLLTDEEEYEARLAAEAELARLRALLDKRNGA